MICSDVRKLLPDLALGDLDAEPASAARAHLQSCAACRAESDSLARSVNVLRSIPSLPPSTERRAAAVAAMSRAHADRAERLLTHPRFRWTPWATAAAFLLALLGALSVKTTDSGLSVVRVSGFASRLDPESGLWRPLAEGEKLAIGDRLETEVGCLVKLASPSLSIILDQESSLDLVGPRRVTLARGRLLASGPLSASGGLVVTDTGNYFVNILGGRIEVSLREVKGGVLGYSIEKGQPAVSPELKEVVLRRLVARVDQGEATLNGSKDQHLRAGARREGSFSVDGQPSTAAVTGEVGAWAASLEERPR